MLTTIMGTGATTYIGLVYLFLMLSSFFSAFWLTFLFRGISHLSMFAGSIPYSFFLLTCLFQEHWSMVIFASILGMAGPPLWVGWGSFIVAISRYIAEGDFIRDTQSRLHARYESTPGTWDSNQMKIQALTDQLITPVGRLNQLLLTTEQLQRLQVSTSQITAMLTSIGSAMMMMNLVVGGLIAYFLLAANTTTDPTTGIITVNSTPLLALYLIISIVSNCFYFYGLGTAPKAIYAPTETPVIITQHDLDQANDEPDSQQRTDEHEAIFGQSEAAVGDSSGYNDDKGSVKGTNSPRLSPTYPHNSPSFLNRTNSRYLTASSSNLTGVIRGNSYIRVKTGSESPSTMTHRGQHGHHGAGGGMGGTPHFGAYDNKNKTTLNTIDGLDLDNLPALPALDDVQMADGSVIAANGGGNYGQKQQQQQQSTTTIKKDGSVLNSTPPPKPKPDNPLIMALNGVHFMWLMIQQRVIYWSLVTWFQQSLPQTVMYSLFSAHIVKKNIGTANTSIYMGTIALFGLTASLLASRYMKTFKHARFLAFAGTISYFVMFCVLLKIRSMTLTPFSAESWVIILCIAGWTGLSDAAIQSGIGASLGIVVEGNALVRSGGFGLNTLFKSCGQIFAYFSTRWISFKAQLITVIVVLVISAIIQVYNYMTHTPIDMVELLQKNEEFTTWSKGLFGNKEEQKLEKDNAIEATLDEL